MITNRTTDALTQREVFQNQLQEYRGRVANKSVHFEQHLDLLEAVKTQVEDKLESQKIIEEIYQNGLQQKSDRKSFLKLNNAKLLALVMHGESDLASYSYYEDLVIDFGSDYTRTYHATHIIILEMLCKREDSISFRVQIEEVYNLAIKTDAVKSANLHSLMMSFAIKAGGDMRLVEFVYLTAVGSKVVTSEMHNSFSNFQKSWSFYNPLITQNGAQLEAKIAAAEEIVLFNDLLNQIIDIGKEKKGDKLKEHFKAAFQLCPADNFESFFHIAIEAAGMCCDPRLAWEMYEQTYAAGCDGDFLILILLMNIAGDNGCYHYLKDAYSIALKLLQVQENEMAAFEREKLEKTAEENSYMLFGKLIHDAAIRGMGRCRRTDLAYFIFKNICEHKNGKFVDRTIYISMIRAACDNDQLLMALEVYMHVLHSVHCSDIAIHKEIFRVAVRNNSEWLLSAAIEKVREIVINQPQLLRDINYWYFQACDVLHRVQGLQKPSSSDASLSSKILDLLEEKPTQGARLKDMRMDKFQQQVDALFSAYDRGETVNADFELDNDNSDQGEEGDEEEETSDSELGAANKHIAWERKPSVPYWCNKFKPVEVNTGEKDKNNESTLYDRPLRNFDQNL